MTVIYLKLLKIKHTALGTAKTTA